MTRLVGEEFEDINEVHRNRRSKDGQYNDHTISVNDKTGWGRVDRMAKRNGQIMIYKTLHRQLQIEQHEPQ